ncbi:polyprenyl synthetase family protein, partial [Schumannella luteola]
MITMADSRTTRMREQFEERFEAYFAEQTTRATLHDARFRELWERVRLLAHGGKRVRPLLLLTAHDDLGGRRRDDALRAAVGVELLHNALVIHDDIIDGDLERRGGPNITAAFASDARARGIRPREARGWGETMALLAGDLLLSAAVREVARIDAPVELRDQVLRILDDGVYLAASGEQADVAFGLGLERPDTESIRTMMHRKTACYSFETPLRVGAALAEAPEQLGHRLGEIGRSLGLLFQMRDDLLGVFGTPAITGKSASGDLREGKVTLLVAYARDTPAWEAVAALWGRAGIGDAEVELLREALEVSGARKRLE